MNKTKMTYFEKDDILHFAISDEEEASRFIRDTILDSVQVKLMSLPKIA